MTKGKYPAPVAALEVIGDGIGAGLRKAMEKERDGFLRLAKSETTANLLHFFFLRERAKSTCSPWWNRSPNNLTGACDRSRKNGGRYCPMGGRTGVP